MARLRNQLFSTYAAEGVNLISGLAFGIMSARALAPEGRGVVAAAWAAVTISLMITNFGASKSLISRLNDSEIQLESADFYGGLIVLLPVMSIFSWIIVFSIAPTFPKNVQFLAWAIFALAVPVMIVTDFTRSVLRAYRQIYILNSVVAVAAIARVSTLGILWSVDRVSIMSVLLIELCYYILIFFVAIIALVKTTRIHLRFSNILGSIRCLLSYGLLFQAYSVLFNMVNKSNIIVLNNLSGDEMTGYFAVGTRLAEYLGVFTNQILFVFVPFLAQKKDKSDAFRYSIKLTRMSVLFLVPVGLLLVSSAHFFIPLLYGKEFVPAVIPFRIMVLAIVAATLFQFSSMAAVATGKLKAVTLCVGLGFFVNAVLMLVFIPIYGAIGAAMAAVGGHFTSLITHLIVLKLWSDVPFSALLLPRWNDLVDMRRQFKKTQSQEKQAPIN